MIATKICGITNDLDAKLAISLGASALGFIFYKKSSRYIDIKAAKMITRNNSNSKFIGVFVDEDSKYIKKVIVNSSKFIKRNGILVLEIGFDQTKKVKKILRENGYYIKDVVRDLAKNYRCIISIKK